MKLSTGLSVFEDALQGMAKKTSVMPCQQMASKTKHLNLWVSSEAPLFDMPSWEKCGDPSMKLADFKGEDAVIALDLPNRDDIAAKVLLFRKNIDQKCHYFVFSTN
jgi:phage terminase large subunit-like protein